MNNMKRLKELCKAELARVPAISLTDRRKDDAENPIDGVTIMSFDSEEDMHKAWNTEVYKDAAKIRESIMRETAIGVHVTTVDEIVKII